MPDLLIYGAPDTSPDLFHAIPEGIVDPFLYVEADGAAWPRPCRARRRQGRARSGSRSSTRRARRRRAARLGHAAHEARLEVALRACRELGVERGDRAARVPARASPTTCAPAASSSTSTHETFVARRRRQDATRSSTGIRRAQQAADAAMAVARDLIHELRPGLTSEEIRAAMNAVCDEHGCDLPDDVIVAHGAQSADGHESGSGPLAAGEPVVVDIWPRDRASRCWADMTRTFVAGGGDAGRRAAPSTGG